MTPKITKPLQILQTLQAFACALSFLTRFPVPHSFTQQSASWRQSPWFYPLVGILIGIVLSAAMLLFIALPSISSPTPTPPHTLSLLQGIATPAFTATPFPLLGAVLLTLLHIWITGALHLDGLADTFDGFGANRPPAHTLLIMKDSQMGVFGGVALVAAILVRLSVYYSILTHPNLSVLSALAIPIVMSVSGKSALCYGMFLMPYSTASNSPHSLGASLWNRNPILTLTALAQYATVVLFFYAVAPTLAPVLLHTLPHALAPVLTATLSIALPVSMIVAMTLAVYWSHICKKKLHGGTGDTLGALSELTELSTGTVLIIFTIF
jgi:adenosylcobinamide-GDP ribazoletransferase